MQRIVASACMALGVWVLAGPGWALLGVGVLLWVRDARLESWLRGGVELFHGLWPMVSGMPRRALAGTSMGLGMVLAPLGVAVAFGAGLGLAVAGGLALLYGYVTGWGA